MPLPYDEIVFWNEPDEKEGNIVREETVEWCIKTHKKRYPTLTDTRALDEFMVVHWAWFKDPEKVLIAIHANKNTQQDAD